MEEINEAKSHFEKGKSLENLEQLLTSESKIDGAKQVSGNLYGYFLEVKESKIKTTDQYEWINKYLDDAHFVEYLMMLSNPIATRWLMQVKDDKRTETLQKITVKDIFSIIPIYKNILFIWKKLFIHHTTE